MLTSGLLSRPTYAESFFHQTTCDIFSLLGGICQDTAPAPQAPATTSPTTTNSTSKNRTAPSNQPTEQPVYTPIDPQNMPHDSLPAVAPAPIESHSVTVSPTTYDQYGLSSVYGGGDASVLGASSQAPLQSSSQGWTVFGMPWYWVLVLVAAVVAAGYAVKSFVRKARRTTDHKVLKF